MILALASSYSEQRVSVSEHSHDLSHLIAILDLRAMKDAAVCEPCTGINLMCSEPARDGRITPRLSVIGTFMKPMRRKHLAPVKSLPGWVITLNRSWRRSGASSGPAEQASATAAAKAGSHAASCCRKQSCSELRPDVVR